MGRDTNVYSANRLSVGLVVLVAGGLGLALFAFYPLLDGFLRTPQFRRPLASLAAIPPDLTILAMRGVAALMIGAALIPGRFLLDPRVVRVDEKGIEVRHFFSVQRGRWRDFASMKVLGGKGTGTIQILFGKAEGFHPKVNLPAKILGVNLEAVVSDIAGHIMAPKKTAEGSLDKYDPKKLAKQAAAAAQAKAEQPAAVQTRRSFGRRTTA